MYDTIQRTPRHIPIVMCLLAAGLLVALGFLPFMRTAGPEASTIPSAHALP